MDLALTEIITNERPRRHFDAQAINAIANHPDVRPTCGGDGQSELDFAAFLVNPQNHALLWKAGAMLFHWSAPATYEVHIMVLPEGRGREAYQVVDSAFDYILEHGAERLWARVNNDSPGLRHFIAQAGFAKCGEDTIDIGFGPVFYDLYQWKKPCLQQS